MCAVGPIADRGTKATAPAWTVARVHEATDRAGVMIRPSGANVMPAVIGEDEAAILAAPDAGLAAA